MARVLILSGAGRYADPWHPFAATSAVIAEELRAAGHDVEVSERVEERLAALRPDEVDLLVVNAGNEALPREGDPQIPDWDAPAPARLEAAMAALTAHVAAGGGVLAVHVSSTTWPERPEWEEILGGRWVRGTTFHPEQGEALIEVTAAHPVTDGVETFTTDDERYTLLRTSAPDLAVLAEHEHEGARHALVWARELPSGARVVYDALGHDAGAYAAPQARRLIANAARWAARA